MTQKTPDISLIIPILNEAAELPGLFASLAVQEAILFEVILCDGGSRDGSQQVARELSAKVAFDVYTINSACGRGLQMNAGAGIARSDLLLFLHADSRFNSATALHSSISTYRKFAGESPQPVAARFRLRFRRQDALPSLAYFFYESKARLDRADCIRGDQGFLLSRAIFNGLGGFDSSLPFLEDLRLASKVAQRGRWLLLPIEISTSARRFETEGLYERQVVNAIITNAVAAGWTDFFTALPGLYHCHGVTGKLQLLPVLDGIRALIAAQPASWRRTFWRATGRYVAGNIWQLFFWLDVRAHFVKAERADQVTTPRLQWFKRNLERYTRGWTVELITAAAVWVWFRSLLIKFRLTTGTS